MEIWKQVPEYEGYYEVSDRGSVRSVDRFVEHSSGRGLYLIKGKILKTRTNLGYQLVNLYKNGVRETNRVHQLVLRAFVGECPAGYVVCHNDGNSSNNTLSNLRYDTQSENCKDIIKHGNNSNQKKISCPLGHKLESPNLIPSSSGRACLACHRARSKFQTAFRRRGVEFSEEDVIKQADYNYRKLLCI